MIKIKVNLPYKKPDETDARDLTLALLTIGASSKYKKELDGQKRRIFGRIQRFLDEAIEKQADFIEVETAEFEFIKKLLGDDVSYPAIEAQNVLLLEDEIERVSDELKKEKETKEETPKAKTEAKDKE